VTIDWIELSKAVPYAAIAVVFGLFMLKVLELVGKQRDADAKRQDEKDERVMGRVRERERERDAQFIDAIKTQDQRWQDFLAQQQILRTKQWEQVIAELKQLTAVVMLSADLLRAHDAWERGLLSSMYRRATDEPRGETADSNG